MGTWSIDSSYFFHWRHARHRKLHVIWVWVELCVCVGWLMGASFCQWALCDLNGASEWPCNLRASTDCLMWTLSLKRLEAILEEAKITPLRDQAPSVPVAQLMLTMISSQLQDLKERAARAIEDDLGPKPSSKGFASFFGFGGKRNSNAKSERSGSVPSAGRERSARESKMVDGGGVGGAVAGTGRRGSAVDDAAMSDMLANLASQIEAMQRQLTSRRLNLPQYPSSN